MVEVLNRVTRARRALAGELDREPTPAEIAARVDVPVEKVELLLRHDREPISLHTSVAGDTSTAELGDLISDDAPDPADRVASSWRRHYVDMVLATLSEREATVLCQRFGLGHLSHVGKQSCSIHQRSGQTVEQSEFAADLLLRLEQGHGPVGVVKVVQDRRLIAQRGLQDVIVALVAADLLQLL